MSEKIPIKFRNPKLQKAFEHYWKSMKCINEDFDPEIIQTFFTSALVAAEKQGYIKL